MKEKIYTHPISVFSANQWGDYDTLVLHLTREPDEPPYLQDDSEWRLQSSRGAPAKTLTESEAFDALMSVFLKDAVLALDK